MKILLLGKGGREYALANALLKSSNCDCIFSWPGSDSLSIFTTYISASSLFEAIKIAANNKVDLCIVGDEFWLVDGEGAYQICKSFNIDCWGPSKLAAELEANKIFAKEFMKRYKIPTSDYKIANNYDRAIEICKSENLPFVIKFDGLAAGKGVKICFNFIEAKEFIKEIFVKKKFGIGKVVIEKFLKGSEFSIFCAVKNFDYKLLIPAKDYKKLKDNNKGPNTGGMGAIASVNLLSNERIKEIEKIIIKPTIYGLRNEGLDYQGFLYFGLMLTENGFFLLEYNCRFGDPEAQAVLPLINGDIALWIKNAAKKNGTLNNELISFNQDWSVCLILASKNYPSSSSSGELITGLNNLDSSQVLHSGTKINLDNKWETNGGRVLSLSYQNENLSILIKNIYKDAEKINFSGMKYRKDIGKLSSLKT